jgi:hypothetical protein
MRIIFPDDSVSTNTITPEQALQNAIKENEKYVADNGILTEVKPTVQPVTPELSIAPVITETYKPLVRPAGISDQVWAVMQSQGADKVAQQQAVNNTITAMAQVQQGIDEAAARAEALNGNNAIASVQLAVQLSNVVSSAPSSNVAYELASQITRAAESAQKAATSPEATADDKTAAQVANILAAQAVADATKIHEAELLKITNDSENTALTLVDKANLPGATDEDILAAEEAKNRYLANTENLTIIQNKASEAQQAATEIKQNSEMLPGEIVDSIKTPDVKQIGLFEQLVNFIYNTIYK